MKNTIKYLLYALFIATIWIATMFTVYYQGTLKGYAECVKDHYKEVARQKQIIVTINEY